MAAVAIYLSAGVLFAQATAAFNCSATTKPIYVDIHNRTVHDSPAFQYGSFIGVGTSAQNHSLWPSLSQNHTSFAAYSYCKDNSTLKDCVVSTGGFFDTNLSSSFQSATVKSLDDSSFTGFFARDTLHLYTHYFETDPASQTNVYNSTIEIATQGSITPGRVGIGSSSTLMRDLVNQGIIGGRTYSLFIGHGFHRANGVVNGSNVFGGYDAGRFYGTPHQYPMNIDNPNPMTVRVKDIIITGSDAQNVSLFDTTVFPNMTAAPSAFDAQITTDQFPLSLPYQITQNFIDKVGGADVDTISWPDRSLRLKNAFNGSLTIVLDDGFTITLPPKVLRNFTNVSPIQERTQDSTAPFYLGSAFLGQTYLMADFDTQNFFLANAVVKKNIVMPTTWCPKTVPVAYVRPQQSDFVTRGLVGAVIGGVIGGLGVLAACFCLWVSCMRKKDERHLRRELEKNQQRKMAQMVVEDVPAFDAPPKPMNAARAMFGRKNKM